MRSEPSGVGLRGCGMLRRSEIVSRVRCRFAPLCRTLWLSVAVLQAWPVASSPSRAQAAGAPQLILRLTPQLAGHRSCSLDALRYIVTFSIRTTYRNAGERPLTFVPATETVAEATYGPTRDAFRTRIGLVSTGDLVVVPMPESGSWPAAGFKTLSPGQSHEGHVEILAVVSRAHSQSVQEVLVLPGAQFVVVTTAVLAADGSIRPSGQDDLRITYATSQPIPVSVPEPGTMRPCTEE